MRQNDQFRAVVVKEIDGIVNALLVLDDERVACVEELKCAGPEMKGSRVVDAHKVVGESKVVKNKSNRNVLGHFFKVGDLKESTRLVTFEGIECSKEEGRKGKRLNTNVGARSTRDSLL